MKQLITTVISCSLCVMSQAQNIGVNTATPKTSLDIKGGIRNQPLYLTGSGTGIIIPDNQSTINLSGSFSGQFSATVNNPEDGQRLIIDNNSNQTGAIIGGPDIRIGLNEYLFSDGEWKTVKMNAWDLNGNFNTNPATQFIGTTDKRDLVFKTNNNENMRLPYQGGLSIGTTVHTEALDLGGNANISGEIKPMGVAGAAGQFLQSNGNGTMQWVSAVSNNIRFGVEFYSTLVSGNAGNYFTKYNKNPTEIVISYYGTILFKKAGLYHFDIYVQGTMTTVANPTDNPIMYVSLRPNYFATIAINPAVAINSTKSKWESHTNKSMDIYIEAETSLTIDFLFQNTATRRIDGNIFCHYVSE